MISNSAGTSDIGVVRCPLVFLKHSRWLRAWATRQCSPPSRGGATRFRLLRGGEPVQPSCVLPPTSCSCRPARQLRPPWPRSPWITYRVDDSVLGWVSVVRRLLKVGMANDSTSLWRVLVNTSRSFARFWRANNGSPMPDPSIRSRHKTDLVLAKRST